MTMTSVALPAVFTRYSQNINLELSIESFLYLIQKLRQFFVWFFFTDKQHHSFPISLPLIVLLQGVLQYLVESIPDQNAFV
jgi:hypothetical protein